MSTVATNRNRPVAASINCVTTETTNGNGERTNGVERQDKHAEINEQKTPSTHVYKVRWLYMLSAAVLQTTQMMFFMCYGPVADATDAYYGQSMANVISAIYMAVAAVGYLPAMWISHRFGLRTMVVYGAWSQLCGAALRCVGDTTLCALLGTAIGATANPFAMSTPTAVAGTWFASSERALCTSLIAMAGPVGIMIASLIAPAMVTAAEDMANLNWLMLGTTALCAIVCTAIVRRNRPQLAPSTSASGIAAIPAFWTGVFKCFKSKSFVVLFLTVGLGVGVFNALYVTIEQILCVRGYGDVFCGWCLVLIIAGGLVCALTTGVYIDKTKHFTEVLKIAFPLTVITELLFCLASTGYSAAWAIGIMSAAFGAAGMVAYAGALELAAECTYPVLETTSAGLIGLSGQIFGLLTVTVFTALGQPPDAKQRAYEVCSLTNVSSRAPPPDYTLSILAISTLGALFVLLAVLGLQPEYKRLQAAADQIDTQIATGEQRGGTDSARGRRSFTVPAIFVCDVDATENV